MDEFDWTTSLFDEDNWFSLLAAKGECAHNMGADFEPADPSVGIMKAAWYCNECGADVTGLDLDGRGE